MKPISWTLFFVLLILISVEGKKLSRGRSSARGSSRKSSNPSPTSLSYPQPSAPKPQPKPSLFGWQEKPAQRTQTSQSRQSKKPSNTQTHSYPSSQTGLSGSAPPKQNVNQQNIQRNSAPTNNAQVPQVNKPSNGHSYPSSQTGLSGNAPAKPPVHQENVQRSNSPTNHAQVPQTNNQNPSYPSSNGLSGNSASGAKYPQGNGLSGSGNAAAPPPYSAGNYPSHNTGQYNPNSAGHPSYGNNYHNQQGPPPPYFNSYGGYGGNQGSMYNSMHQMPGYYGNYGKGYGGVSRTSTALKGIGIAGAGVGTLLTGLALWNLARSTGHRHHTVIYERGQPVGVAPNNATEPVVSDLLGELVNCSLTISSENSSEILLIPCAIATSFTPDADVKDVENAKNPNDTTKCIVTVVTKTGKEYMTTIPCSILLKTAAENNVTEAPILQNDTLNSTNIVVSNAANETVLTSDAFALQTNSSNSEPLALMLTDVERHNISKNFNCTPEPGDIRDPINPCFAVQHNLTVIPLLVTDYNTEALSTPSSA